MVEFKTVEPQDIMRMREIFNEIDLFGCEYCACDVFGWSKAYGSKIAFLSGLYCSRAEIGFGARRYICPCGDGNLPDAVMELIETERECGGSVFEMAASAKQAEQLPDIFERVYMRDWSDYIYNAQDLINLSGRKYHSKRNFIAQFSRAYEWHFEPLNAQNAPDCLEVADKWRLSAGPEDEELAAEYEAINRMLTYSEPLALTGGIIYVNDGVPVAFALGSSPRRNLLIVHIEKALPEYKGAYAVINREFARFAAAGCEYINREEDLGEENLRTAKLSYHPAFLNDKYLLRTKL